MKRMADLFFGYHMPNYTYSGARGGEIFDRLVEQATAAEAAGFDMVTVMDHFYQIRGVGPETEPMMEAYTTLGAIAARTSRVKLATMVSGVTYRNPAWLAKMATTLDVISKGRAIFGIGAAWHDSEHAGYGFEFPPIGEREDRLEEAVTIAKLMFTQDRPSFEGKHYRIDRALNVPRPVQPRRPEDPDRRRRRDADPAHPREAWRYGPPVRRPDRRAEAQARRLPQALRNGGPRPFDREAVEGHPRDPGRERSRCESPARQDPRGAPRHGFRGHARGGRRSAAALHRCGLRRVHLEQPDAADQRGDRTRRGADQAAVRGACLSGRPLTPAGRGSSPQGGEPRSSRRL